MTKQIITSVARVREKSFEARASRIALAFALFYPPPQASQEPSDTVCAWMDVRTPVAQARLVAGLSTVHASTDLQRPRQIVARRRVVRSWYSSTRIIKLGALLRTNGQGCRLQRRRSQWLRNQGQGGFRGEQRTGGREEEEVGFRLLLLQA